MFVYGRTYLSPSNQPDHVLIWSPTHKRDVPLSHMKCSKTCFGFFWQINQASATAQHMERLPVETNTSACHALTLVCKQEVVCVVCVRWFLPRRSAPCQRSFTRVYTDVPLWADGCVFGTTKKAGLDFLFFFVCQFTSQLRFLNPLLR